MYARIRGSNNSSLYARVPSLWRGLSLDMPTSVSKSITERMRVLSLYMGLSLSLSLSLHTYIYIYKYIYTYVHTYTRVLDFIMRPSLYAHFTMPKGSSLCVSTLDFRKLSLSLRVYYSLKAIPLPSSIFPFCMCL